jgi:hypothetical protein
LKSRFNAEITENATLLHSRVHRVNIVVTALSIFGICPAQITREFSMKQSLEQEFGLANTLSINN